MKAGFGEVRDLTSFVLFLSAFLMTVFFVVAQLIGKFMSVWTSVLSMWISVGRRVLIGVENYKSSENSSFNNKGLQVYAKERRLFRHLAVTANVICWQVCTTQSQQLLHLHVNAALSSKNSLIDRISNIKSTTKQPEYITAPGCKPSQLQ